MLQDLIRTYNNEVGGKPKPPKIREVNMIQTNISTGTKITILKFNAFGEAELIQTIYRSIEMVKHYKLTPKNADSIKLTHKPKGCKKDVETIINHSNTLIIYDGFFTINTRPILRKIVRENNLYRMSVSKHLYFDKQQIKDLSDAMEILYAEILFKYTGN